MPNTISASCTASARAFRSTTAAAYFWLSLAAIAGTADNAVNARDLVKDKLDRRTKLPQIDRDVARPSCRAQTGG